MCISPALMTLIWMSRVAASRAPHTLHLPGRQCLRSPAVWHCFDAAFGPFLALVWHGGTSLYGLYLMLRVWGAYIVVACCVAVQCCPMLLLCLQANRVTTITGDKITALMKAGYKAMPHDNEHCCTESKSRKSLLPRKLITSEHKLLKGVTDHTAPISRAWVTCQQQGVQVLPYR